MGFDRALFIDSVPVDCICPICQDVLEDARETIGCQHGFCGACIFRWLSEHRSCPSCRSPITADDIRPIHRIWREKLVGLRMKCANAVHGCTVETTLKELPDHLFDCKYEHIPCPHTSCPEVVLRTLLANHVIVCQYRKILCDDCGLEFLATESASHKCVVSLREHMREQIEASKKEMITECVKLMRRERRHYDNLLQEQKKHIDDLRRALNNLVSHQRLNDKLIADQHPLLCPTSRGASANPVVIVQSSHLTSDGRRGSLPRLAPLHTHMNISSRTTDQSRSRTGDSHR